MEWLKIKIDTVPKGIDPVSDIFYSCGIYGLEIEDCDEFLQTLELTKQNWDFVEESLYEEKKDKSSVAAYIAANEKSGEVCALIKTEVQKLKVSDTENIFGSLEVTVESMDEESWADNWKKYFKPLPIGERVLVNPVWEKIPDEYSDRTVFMIDPGMSFGTGSHETTKLCIESIQKYLKTGNNVLDLGCGSGILFIISLLLGACKAKAIDIDENSVNIAKKNAVLNNINESKYSVFLGDVTKDEKLYAEITSEKYDIVLANIVADVIIPIVPLVKKVLKKDAVFISSGIINTSADRVKDEILKNGFNIIEIVKENDWVSIVCKI